MNKAITTPKTVVKNIDIRASFSAASTFPAKLLVHEKLIKTAKVEKKILPLHVQLNPTNRCNFNCSFCSCSARDRSLEISLKRTMDIMNMFKKLGAESVTITGGGEPLMHRHINRMILGIRAEDLEVGLVTNGVLLHKLSDKALREITWIRISSADTEEYLKYSILNRRYLDALTDTVHRGKNIDWAFSHVLTRSPKLDIIEGIVNFANKHNFTHVRLVSDLLDLNSVEDMKKIRERLAKRKINDSRVIYQGRKDFAKGAKKCYLSLLKPVVGADGLLYPCCGTQYALANPSRDYEKKMRIGKAEDFPEIFGKQKYFDGSICEKCYYSDYNYALGIMLSDIKHQKFV
ncbi:MAG: radical SAM protein [Candidatus Bathyarchaeota archaeon]